MAKKWGFLGQNRKSDQKEGVSPSFLVIFWPQTPDFPRGDPRNRKKVEKSSTKPVSILAIFRGFFSFGGSILALTGHFLPFLAKKPKKMAKKAKNDPK